MNKLKNKTFGVICILLSLFSLIIVFIFNYQIYQKEEKNIANTIVSITKINNSYFDRLPVFLDVNAYVIYFDRRNTVSKIVSYANDGLSNEQVALLAVDYMNNYGKSKEIGNLFNNYLYYVNDNNSLIIFDNSDISNLLFRYLKFSILMFLLFEIINILISYKLTSWLVIPVEDSFNKQKQFIYDVSHELKTPIAVIMANADMVEKNPKDIKWISNIKSESDRMNKLVVGLLDLLSSDNINIKESFSKVNLSKCIEMCVLTFESLIYENNLKLEYDIDENIYFSCNSERIKQLFGILVDNAIKHAETKSVITIKLKNDKNGIMFSVKNKGEAIPLEEREKIFERLYRSDKSRNRNSNRYGLGLAIAKNIVNVHNGKISVSCHSGYTTFKVIFKNLSKI